MTLKTDESLKTGWYVVHTKPRQEVRALKNLQNQQFECFLPMLKAQKIRASRLSVVEEPLFSRYLFIFLTGSEQNWAPIRSTMGVARLVQFGSHIARVPDEFIGELKQMAEIKVRHLFEAGDSVQVRSGPLAGLSGVFDNPDGEARAFVLLELLGKTHQLSVNLADLRQVA